MSHFTFQVLRSRAAARGLRAFALATLLCVTASACAKLDDANAETLFDDFYAQAGAAP